MGVTVGIVVTLLTAFFINYQQKKAFQAAKGGDLPSPPAIGTMKQYASDRDGDYFWARSPDSPAGGKTVRVWSKLAYSDDGKKAYVAKRTQAGLFVGNMEHLSQRVVLYEFKCGKEAKVAIVEIFETDKEGRTLDYARSGSIKEWDTVPAGAVEEKLAAAACSGSP